MNSGPAESEAEVAEFMSRNWKKLGLFEYYFEFCLVGGDAVAVEKGELVGIEFETRPGLYLDHQHHLNPSHASVKYLICNRPDGVPRSQFPRRLVMILTKFDLERMIERNPPEPSKEAYEKAKQMVERGVADYLKELYRLSDCKVKLPE